MTDSRKEKPSLVRETKVEQGVFKHRILSIPPESLEQVTPEERDEIQRWLDVQNERVFLSEHIERLLTDAEEFAWAVLEENGVQRNSKGHPSFNEKARRDAGLSDSEYKKWQAFEKAVLAGRKPRLPEALREKAEALDQRRAELEREFRESPSIEVYLAERVRGGVIACRTWLKQGNTEKAMAAAFHLGGKVRELLYVRQGLGRLAEYGIRQDPKKARASRTDKNEERDAALTEKYEAHLPSNLSHQALCKKVAKEHFGAGQERRWRTVDRAIKARGAK